MLHLMQGERERGIVRVIAGSAKGRRLASVRGAGTRPITARAKGALFNILGPDIRGATFLDLFAGTGSVGIEALSRGARRVTFVERARKGVATVRRNLESTRLTDRAEVVHGDAFRFIDQAPVDLCFDYVYVAPPQYRALWAKALLALDSSSLVAADGLIIVQIHPKEYEELVTLNLRHVDERRYGSTLLQFYAWEGRMATESDGGAI